MDANYDVSTLNESKNEWTARLVNVLSPQIIHGLRSIFAEAVKTCNGRNEIDKYLMTFQNMLVAVPAWNSEIIAAERRRICDKSGCVYLEDLVTCVHIIQLKILSAMRVGQKQKKVEIPVPKLDEFVHKVYIHSARRVYSSVYLFEQNITPLQIQRNNRDLELIIQECILNAVRESIPVESLLKSYLNDDAVEEDVVTKVTEVMVPSEATASTSEPIASELSKPVARELSKPVASELSKPVASELSAPVISEATIVREPIEQIVSEPTTNFEKPSVSFSPDVPDYNLKIGDVIGSFTDLPIVDLDKSKDEAIKLDIVDLEFPELNA
jgi:hypothetical protein